MLRQAEAGPANAENLGPAEDFETFSSFGSALKAPNCWLGATTGRSVQPQCRSRSLRISGYSPLHRFLYTCSADAETVRHILSSHHRRQSLFGKFIDRLTILRTTPIS